VRVEGKWVVVGRRRGSGWMEEVWSAWVECVLGSKGEWVE